MKIPYWLLKLLPMWDYICPKCRKEVAKNSHKCIHCGEEYGVPIRVPPKVLKDAKALEEYVHTHVFPKVSAQQRAYLTQFFTVLLSSGWENSEGTDITDGGVWSGTTTGGSGVINVATDRVHHGNYSAKSAWTTTDSYAFLYGPFATTNLTFSRLYFQLDALPPSPNNSIVVFHIRDDVASRLLLDVKILNSADSIVWLISYRHDGSIISAEISTSPPTADEWICLEVKVDCSTTDGQTDGSYAVYKDGELLWSIEDRDTDSTFANLIRVGNVWSVGSYSNALWIDCVIVADTGPIGPEEIVPLTVTTVDATGVTKDSAILNGHIATEGEVTVTERGFEWLKAGESEWISWTEEEEEGFEDGDYEHEITDLERGILYYVKAKAYHEEEEEWVYGVEKYFTTKQYFIRGITKDANGNVLGECAVLLFKADNTYVDGILSDSETGEYEFEVDDDTTEYWLRAYKDGETNVFGTTDIVTGETE